MTKDLRNLLVDKIHAGRWLGWLLLLPAPVIAFAMWQYGLLDNVRADYLQMLFTGFLCMALAAGAAWGFTAKRWGNAVAPTTAAMLVAAAFIYYAGAAATLSALLLMLAAVGVGSYIDAARPVSPWVRLLVGLAIIAAAVGWLLPFQVHDTRIYLLLIGVVGLSRRAAIARDLGTITAAWRELAVAHPVWLTLAVAATGIATLGLWLPSLNYDDNAAHLILADQLLTDGYYRMDVSSQVWAVAPWANNVLHGVAALLAGQEARASVNLLWLLIGVSGAYRLALAVGAPYRVALATAAVYASHPLTAHFSSSMQVDAVVAATVLHFAVDMLKGKGRIDTPWSTGALLGLLAGLKTSNVVYVFLPLIWIVWNGLKNREFSRLFAMAATAALVGGSSYTYAAAVTGNPIFPLFNAIFQSPFMPLDNFHDGRWSSGLDWRSLWDVTFETGRFGEVYPGAAGIALLAVFSGLCAELVRPRAGRWVAVWLLVAGALMFWQIQYLRYVFPAIAVLTTLGLVGLSRYVDKRAFSLAVVLIIAANAMLMPTTSWIARENPWGKLVKDGVSAKAGIERSFIPERALLERLRVNSPTACVLMSDPQSPFVGGFGGRANAMAWYDPRLSEARSWAEADASGDRWRQLLQSIGASHVVLRSQVNTALTKGLGAIGYTRVDSEGSVEVWANVIPQMRKCNPQFQQQRNQAHRMFLLGGRH